jgi:(1->4)-alpha-D-glucan 1-alpha-D-glucosylmutase
VPTDPPLTERALPRATYRLQLQPDFGFDAAAAACAYLADLGISHVYASPYLQAAPGSTHGYDVTDPRSVNVELGGTAGRARFIDALRENHLGQVLDIVPNHMAIVAKNPWWWDVLENGPGSRYARFFDVDWDTNDPWSNSRVLLPVLADHYGKELESGKFSVAHDERAFTIRYGDQRFPIAPGSLETVLGSCAPSEQALADLNADMERLDALLEAQHYRLAAWSTARGDLDYRRFFDVTSLAGLRTEDGAVFDATHELIVGWLADGTLDGLRVDHPDGLRDPKTYLDRLRAAGSRAWIVVEKILARDESLPRDWPVDGTTGYDFMTLVGQLYVDPGSEAPLTALYREFNPAEQDYMQVAYEARQQVLSEVLAPELVRVAELFLHAAHRQRTLRDYTRAEVRSVLRETICAFPVYRTYVRADGGVVAEGDVAVLEHALRTATARRPDLSPELFDFVRDILLLRIAGPEEAEAVMRFQQLTGPVMAKGLEDTAFYRYNRLVSLNEVGGDPGHFGVTLDEFYAACGRAADETPGSMLAGTTHDTKRSEDVRARIALLSELPHEWAVTVRAWSALNADRRAAGSVPVDGNTEYLIYQTLVGTWPISAERLGDYLRKAIREAKQATSWTNPDEAYESAVLGFAEACLGDSEFVGSLEGFVTRLTPYWQVSALAQLLLRLTAPGVPDIYQGSELWALSLVDPDNRRPVDFQVRRELLRRARDLDAPSAITELDSGLAKTWLLARTLRVRAEQPAAFGRGAGFVPLRGTGEQADKAVAFVRGDRVAVVVPRLVVRLDRDWKDTTLDLPPGIWRDAFTQATVRGGWIRLADLLASFPMALLIREDA